MSAPALREWAPHRKKESPPMQDITREDLEQHLERLSVATQDELDELLTDLLVAA